MALLEAKNIDVFHGDFQVLFDLSLEVEENGITAIVGANGAGKTTLMNTISGILHPKRGNIIYENTDITFFSPDEIVKRGIVQVPEGRSLFPFLTVKENLLLAAWTKKARAYEDRNLEFVFTLFPKLKERLNQLAGSLSGGEQQMCAIGRALMTNPKLILLDEPSLGLAPIVVESLFHTIQELSSNGYTVLLVEQNVGMSLELSKSAYVIQEGKVVMKGKGKEILMDEKLRTSYLGL